MFLSKVNQKPVQQYASVGINLWIFMKIHENYFKKYSSQLSAKPEDKNGDNLIVLETKGLKIPDEKSRG